jgi:hypothetical protein
MKVRIPNTRGHYEMQGLEIDVDDRDIIIRSSASAENKERYQREKQPEKRRDPAIGPVTSRLLSKLGLGD